MSDRVFTIFFWILLTNILLANGLVKAENLQEFVRDNQNKPADIVDKLKQLPHASFSDFSPQLLSKLSYASAVTVDIPLTLELTEILLDKSRQLNDARHMSHAYYNRGAVYALSGRQDLALDALLLSLSSLQNGEYPKEEAKVKGGLALIYVELGEYSLASPYFEEAISFNRKADDKMTLAKLLQNRGFMRILQKEYSRAKADLVEAIHISRTLQLTSNFPVLFKNLGKIELGMGNSEDALVQFELALSTSEKAKLPHLQSEIRREIAELYVSRNEVQRARQNVLLSIEIGQKYQLVKQLAASFALLAKIEALLSRYEAAYQAKLKSESYFEEMGNTRIAANLSRLDRYTTRLKEQSERALLEKEKKIATLAAEREAWFKNFFIAVATIAILMTVYFIRRFSHSKKQAVMFEKQSKIDPLTGVWNRRAGEAKLERLCNREKGSVTVFSIAMLDIDHFKRVNDKFGHDIGDKVIKSVCKIIEQNLRPTDMMCRWGGEEFLLILENFDAKHASFVCERIRRTIENSQIRPVGDLTVSIGISMFDDDDIYDLVKRGDQALYHAKHLGRNRVVVRNKAVASSFVEQLQIFE
ncbi:diguanylate cyclase [Aliikangiella sp. G2MR2-5]|uniref:tetratricopeptide repeat-containing diguanylate cyclase n=1 Tax=Aliikangiella sp. G2MR2-5 TaxID=2788943 RepID=UPI0018AB1B5D|nr:diguanylate cyclase [Aliikangiella sp. G2MR2-5]